MHDLTDQMAVHIVRSMLDATITPIAPDVRARALALLLDYLAVVVRGAATPVARASRAALAAGVDGVSAVAGTNRRAGAADAAFLNGIAAHAIELDDTYEPASIHPGVAVWPAVLAVAEETDATVGELIRAAVAGYDAACAAGDRLDPGVTYSRGFHPTGVCGPLGAAAAVADLLRLDAGARRDAEGIAASASGGLLEFLADGAWTKPLHAGQAAAAGVRAARLAAAGFRGPADAIDGAHGFLHAFGGRPADAVRPSETPAAGWGLLGTSVKPFPCCRYIHGCLDLLLEIRRERSLEAGDVDEVLCGVLSAGWDLVAGPREVKLRVKSQVEGQFSLPFAAALALTHGHATLEDFEAAAGLAPTLAPLMARVQCRRSPRLDAAFPAAWGAEVEVRLRSGETITRAIADAPGSPSRPLSEERLLAKAADLTGADAAAALARACADALDDDPVRELVTTLSAQWSDINNNG